MDDDVKQSQKAELVSMLKSLKHIDTKAVSPKILT